MTRKFRTAVLVVHGMGSQRPLETVRGIVDAAWLCGATDEALRKFWTHPELSGADVDLAVLTTNESDIGRVTDFHEFYWAHLMSETKAVAVLLWLFELSKRGPLLRRGMNMLWWCATTYLALLILSVVLVALKATTLFADLESKPASLLTGPTLMIVIAVATIVACTCASRAFRFTELLLGLLRRYWYVAVVSAAVLAALIIFPVRLLALADILPTYLIAFAIVAAVMGSPGVRSFGLAVALSVIFFAFYLISLLSN